MESLRRKWVALSLGNLGLVKEFTPRHRSLNPAYKNLASRNCRISLPREPALHERAKKPHEVDTPEFPPPGAYSAATTVPLVTEERFMKGTSTASASPVAAKIRKQSKYESASAW